jgi:hypothetical protein
MADETAALVELAGEVGAATANIETLAEATEEVAQQQEIIQDRQRWNDEALDRAFEKIYALEDRIIALELAEEIEELEEIEEVEEEAEPEPKIEPTIIEGTKEPESPAAPAVKKKINWGVL